LIRYFFNNLRKSELLAFLTALATISSLIVEAALSPTTEWVRVIPIAILLIYLIFHISKVWKFSRQTHKSIPLPYFICLAQNHEWYISAIKQQEEQIRKSGISWGSIQDNYKIHRQDWAYFDSSKLKDESSDWIHKTKEISQHFEHLANRVEAQPLFHVFVAAPAPIALGVGAIFSGRIPFSVYQHAGMVETPYKQVHDSNSVVTAEDGYHILHIRATEFKHIEIKEEESNQNNQSSATLIVLDFTGHRLPKPYPLDSFNKHLRVGPIGVEGHIPLNQEWMSIAQEIASIISGELNNGNSVSVLLGMPSSLAFLVGTILRTSSRVDIYYYNRSLDKYHKAFNLSELD
jgi:hypothetical protein